MAKRFGAMLDMSRNGVMKPEQVKTFAHTLKTFGYNMLQLYMEDTYEIPGEPYFGYMRGRYTQEELKDIVSHCESMGVEVIPCIQTLAHLKTIFHWNVYAEIRDIDDILLAEEERTYILIENMFKALRPCFTSEYIHIGMDEAHMLGLGKYLDKHGVKNRFGILRAHLQKVLALAKKYGFKPIMWSDMFFRLGNKGEYSSLAPVVTEKMKKAVPEGVGLVYWNYYYHEKKIYDEMLSAHKKLGSEIWYAGGAWTWMGFAPGNKKTLETAVHGMRSAAEHGIENVFITLWGDNGKECSYYAVLPALFAAKRFYDGCTDMEAIKTEFEAVTGESFDGLCALDLPNYIGGNDQCTQNACKVMFYSDPFKGFLDSTIPADVSGAYKEIAKKLRLYGQRSRYSYIFECEASLCDFLSIKYQLGERTRKAYQAADREELRRLTKEYACASERLDIFYKSLYNLWKLENKPQGFDVLELRIGGLMLRLRSCGRQLIGYLNGEEKILPELEEKLLDFYGNGEDFRREIPCLIDWIFNASVNII